MTLESWGGVSGCNFWFRMWILTVTRCLRVLRMALVQNRRFSIFSHRLMMKGSQNWTDLRSPISKLWDIGFIDTVACINCWKVQDNRSGVTLKFIQTFYEVRSLDVTWWPDLAWPGSEIFIKHAEKMYDKVCQKRWRCVLLFFGKLLRPEAVSISTPAHQRMLTWSDDVMKAPEFALLRHFLMTWKDEARRSRLSFISHWTA